eukprot:15451440-Alexandrium_andersonii.AAC.1
MLIGTPSWLPALKRPLPRDAHLANKDTTIYYVKYGQKRFVGGCRLKETQQYPDGYRDSTAALLADSMV